MEDTHREAIERPERIPLDEVLVELCSDSPDEAFEADGLNVSPGGLAVRSPLLPEVGSRMSCRFQSPVDGSLIDADCEVVWSADQGPHLGEFGLRFERLSGESAEALRRLVEPEDRVMTAAEAADLGWSAAPETGPVTIALSLDGVASDLIAEVVHEDDQALVAEQELPFLRLGTGVVTEEGRRGVLRSVELRLDADLPRLVLTIDYEEGDASSAQISDESDAFAHAVDDGETRDELARSGDEAELETSLLGADHDTIPDATPTDRETPVVFATHRAQAAEEPRESRAARTPAPAREEPRTHETKRTLARDVGEPVLARANAVAAAMKDATSERLSSALPVVRDGLGQARETAAAAASTGYARTVAALRALATHLRRFVALLRARQLEAEKANAAAAVPVRRVQRRPGERTPEAEPKSEPDKKVRGRHLVLGLFGALVLVLAVRGVMRAPDSSAVPAPTVPASAPVVAEAPPAPAVAPAPTTPVPAANAQAAAPTVTSPTYEGGPIPSPTYPSMARPDQPAEVAAPAPTTPPSRHFGAASVPGAMPFELLMTTPIERIQGEETANGFTVEITRSNSLTRASPIAARHPSVDRASVSNLGENATLRIDFKPGQHPAYRVEANGNRLRILIGR